MEIAPIPDRVTAWAVELPLRQVFTSAGSSLRTRKLAVVAIDTAAGRGWGEAAPVPGHTAETIDEVWAGLEAAARNAVAGQTPTETGMAHAALAQATADLAAKNASLPLWRYLGGQHEVWASAAVGLDDSGQPDLEALQQAAAQGYRHAKLKITPHTDPTLLQEARDLTLDVGLGLDGNASLSHHDIDLLTAVDAMGFAYIEQPGAATDLDWHARLRRQMATPIALDEAADTDSTIARILESEAADIVNLKVGRFGPWRTLALARQIIAAGRKVRLGGLIETGIGRAHAVALATCSEFSVAGDIAASDRYFHDDLVSPPWRLDDGRLSLPTEPGIGVAVSEDAVDRYAYDSFSIG